MKKLVKVYDLGCSCNIERSKDKVCASPYEVVLEEEEIYLEFDEDEIIEIMEVK